MSSAKINGQYIFIATVFASISAMTSMLLSLLSTFAYGKGFTVFESAVVFSLMQIMLQVGIMGHRLQKTD
jgi:hypothetical protein